MSETEGLLYSNEGASDAYGANGNAIHEDVENCDHSSDDSSKTSYHEENEDSFEDDSYSSKVDQHVKSPVWKYSWFRAEGRVMILGEWKSKTKSQRYFVIGPDWPCVIITYVMVIVPSIFTYLYLLQYLAELVILSMLLASTIFGLTAVFLSDPGLVRKYHHSRSRKWTFCDQCEAFRPPGTVHCSTCQVCIMGYDHHCPWTGKCVGIGNALYFNIFLVSISWLVIYFITLGILKLALT